MRSTAAGCALLLALAPSAHGSPYRITDADAADRWELKVLAESEDVADFSEVDAPVFDITAPVRPGLETSVTFGWGQARDAGVRSNGFLDLEWAVKGELMRQDRGDFFSIAVEPAIIAPTGAGGFSDHAWSLEVPFIISREIGALEVRALASYAHRFADEEADEVGADLLAIYSLTETFSVGAEAGLEAAPDELGDGEKSFGVGASWEFTPGTELQIRAGVTRDDEESGRELAVYIEHTF